MESIISYFSNHSFLDLLSALVVVIAVVVGVEKFFKWLYDLFTKLYKQKKGQEEETSIIDKNTMEIKKLAESIEKLSQKIDEQKDRLEIIDKEGKKRDCSLLRDRILGACRYFGQNKDEYGNVVISVSEHENIQHLFEAYFSCGGNGTIKTLYENDFCKWKIED